jgi:hypothetical protein
MATPRTHRRIPLAGLAAAALALAAPNVAGAEGAATPTATDALCTNALVLELSPGFVPTPGSGRGTSHGERGTLVCVGRLYGHRITGPGIVGVEETYTTGAACLTDSSSGQVTATLPTTGGPLHVVGALSAHRVGAVEAIDIAFPQAHFSGAGPVAPIGGTCLLAPLTRALVSISGELRG